MAFRATFSAAVLSTNSLKTLAFQEPGDRRLQTGPIPCRAKVSNDPLSSAEISSGRNDPIPHLFGGGLHVLLRVPTTGASFDGH